MQKYIAIAAAAICASSIASAQMSTTEKTVSTETNGNLQTTKETVTKTDVNVGGQVTTKVDKQYSTRLDSAYRAAGVADADIIRLRDIDTRAYDVVKVQDRDKVKIYYEQQAKILKPEQVEKVRVYLRENPVPAGYTIRSTWETYPTGLGVGVTTPIGNIGIGVPTGSTVIERKEVVPVSP
jgi:hypothetical protein